MGRSVSAKRVITRAEWGAAPPTRPFLRTTLPWPRMWLHHTDGPFGGAQVMRDTQRYHQQTKGWRDFAYNFAVGDGIFEGMGLHRHLNTDHGGSGTIVLLGHYHQYPVSDETVEDVAWLLVHGWLSGWWQHPRLDGGHRDLSATACPGDYGYLRIPDMNDAASDFLNPSPEPSQEDDDMLLLIKEKGTDPVFLTDFRYRWPVTTQARMDILTSPLLGNPTVPGPVHPWHEWSHAEVEDIPLAPTAIDPKALASAIAKQLPPGVTVDVDAILDEMAGRLAS